MEAFAAIQKELFDRLLDAHRSWIDRMQLEATLAAEFAAKMREAHSAPEIAKVYQEWATRHIEMTTEDAKHLFSDGQKLIEAGAHVRVEGSRCQNREPMMTGRSSCGPGLPPGVIFRNADQCLPAAEPTGCGLTKNQLRSALAQSEALLRQKDELIQRQELLRKESDHRLINDLQMTISLLSLQSRAAINPEVAAQLAVAANRVSMIARIHYRLHSNDGVQTIDLKDFLEDFGRDFSAMLSSDDRPEQIVVEGVEINLPAATAIPLGFIVSELITNAAKYGDGRIVVSLQPDPAFGYALTVANGGPALPEGFDPGANTGLGMRIIQSFTRQIGGELRISRGHDGQGARFTVLFPEMVADAVPGMSNPVTPVMSA